MSVATTSGTPSTVIRACSGSTRCPSVAGLPSTWTRPAPIRSSHTRRDPSPARARTFCSRSPDGWRSVVETRLQFRGDLVDLGDIDLVDQDALDVDAAVFVVDHDGGIFTGEAQPPLQRLDDHRVGHEVAERRQLVERVEPESFEEDARGREQGRVAGRVLVADLFDVTARDEGPQR